MIISPLQPDYVTRKEFDSLTSHMDDGFEKSFEQVDTVENNLTKRIDTVETNLTDKIDTAETNLSQKIEIVEGGLTKKIDDLKSFNVEGFEKMESYIDATKREIVTELKDHMDNVTKKEIISEIKGHIDLVIKK